MAKLSNVIRQEESRHSLSEGSQEPRRQGLKPPTATPKRRAGGAGLFSAADGEISHSKLHPLT